MIKALVGAACVAALVGVGSFAARAESGDLNIDGTWVHVEIDHARDIGTFSNDCGTQVLTHQELGAGAKPYNIIPCPRPRSGPSAACNQVKADYDYQMHKRPMSDAWKRALMCIPGLMCEAKCSDFDDYEAVLNENRDLERKWVLQCNGTLTTGNGDTIDEDGIDDHEDKIYQDFLQKKRQVCEAEGQADLTRQRENKQKEKEKEARCEQGVELARKLARDVPSDARSKLRTYPKLQQTMRAACDDLDLPPPISFTMLDNGFSKEIEAARQQLAAKGAGTPEGASCGDAGGHVHGSACWILGVTRSDCEDLHGTIVDSGGYQYCAYDPTAVTQAAGAAPGQKAASDDLRERLRKSLGAGGNASADDSDDATQAAPPAAGAAKPAPPPQQAAAQKTMTPAEAQKACAALGAKWRYDPTATSNFAPNAPPKCFPVFTDSLQGEPGFETK